MDVEQQERDREQLHEVTMTLATLCVDIARAMREIRLATTDLEHRLETYGRELREMGADDD